MDIGHVTVVYISSTECRTSGRIVSANLNIDVSSVYRRALITRRRHAIGDWKRGDIDIDPNNLGSMAGIYGTLQYLSSRCRQYRFEL